MARRSVLSEEETTEINLSPMIDCIFILLIFFIVTTVFVEEKGLQVAKPDAAAAAPTEESNALRIDITAENKIRFDGKEIAISDVAGLIQSGLEDPETGVTIRAHEKSDHGTFVAVWDAARRGGAVMLSFSTVN